jgi:hypothetical protein
MPKTEEVHNFNEVNQQKNQEPTMASDVAAIAELMGEQITVFDKKAYPRTYDGREGFLYEFLFEGKDKKKKVFFTWSSVLSNQYDKAKDSGKLPFKATLSKTKNYYSFV